ncbi:Lysine-specific demethylase 8 [Hypsizygus marmoreus]|uniref:Lysine-specific demethylase 8 n=1 Tax=Hypsizygus marmoreus TaxID=39966 RepID=A0A369JGG4_HYPMA|nr:Lysine-specific demethylase 8 [Hypsizygus marmoreus]
MDWRNAFIQLILENLDDSTNPLTASLHSCGPLFLANIRSNAKNLAAGVSIPSSCANLEILRERSRSQMASSRGPSLTGWIRLYTDASILRCLADVSAPTAVQSIGYLDGIIVTCGPASGRLDLILSLIEIIQYKYLPMEEFTFQAQPDTSPPLSQPENFSLRSSSRDIPSFNRAPSVLTFQRNLSNRPFIVRGYGRDWPALAEHPWRSAAYLRSVAGPGRVVPVEIGEDYRESGWRQSMMSWENLLSSLDFIDQPPAHGSTEIIYLAQHNLLMQFPALREDIIVPDYVYAAVDPPEYLEYKPPGNDEQLVLNGWLGPKGTISPAHTDPYYNFFAQVVGRKTVWLAPPDVTPFMYPFELTSHSSESAPNMHNTSRVDVFSAKEEEDFPDFWEKGVREAFHETIGPGDLLFIPVGWWHAMRSEDTSFSVSMWF